jgi:hypothetical protein
LNARLRQIIHPLVPVHPVPGKSTFSKRTDVVERMPVTATESGSSSFI